MKVVSLVNSQKRDVNLHKNIRTNSFLPNSI